MENLKVLLECLVTPPHLESNDHAHKIEFTLIDSADLYTSEFLQQYTRFKNHSEFFESYSSIFPDTFTPLSEQNKFMQTNTSFETWDEMYELALEQWEHRNL
ncbi:hypothetical protein [Cytobacillus sp. IB215316]|uniref:hypothetical protein n=1 Tax=Cytobacillus sp. IB215316 TaxID=3097354 RepID=UPI002A125797|nr:hypothetical protein [Cytobacillus sp. IB215316]MDX8362746.1 hypothetical protein [Cytobacillus sp. IB215316]